MKNKLNKEGEISSRDQKRYLIAACSISKRIEMVLTPLSADPRIRDIDLLDSKLMEVLEEMALIKVERKEKSINNIEREQLLQQGREEGRTEEQKKREGRREEKSKSVCWGCKQDHRREPCNKGCKRCGRYHNGDCRIPASIVCNKCNKAGHEKFVCSMN